MAPAAMDTMLAHFRDTGRTPDDYDMIVTGDLGKFGSEILIDLMEMKGIKLGLNYNDCGQMYFTRNQNTLSGGSGCGCSATVLNSFIMKKLRTGELQRVLFMPTGALMSTTASQQGETIPAVCHALVIESDAKLVKGENIEGLPIIKPAKTKNKKESKKDKGNKDIQNDKEIKNDKEINNAKEIKNDETKKIINKENKNNKEKDLLSNNTKQKKFADQKQEKKS